MTKQEFLKTIYEKYNFTKDEDIFVLEMGRRKIPIVTKTGMQKIVTQEGFKYFFEVVVCEPNYCAVKCTISDGENILASSFGSAEGANVSNKSKYYLEMAEKRSKVRAVLIAINGHGYLYSEEEADDFKRQ